MSNAVLTLIVLAVVAFFFVTELLPLAVTAMAGAIAVGVLGIIPMNQVFSGLSNSTVVLFAAMFVIGAAMFQTGLAQKIGATVVKTTGTGENSLMFGTMLVAAGLSSVTSNTATTACLIPVVVGICKVARIPANRQLMPLAFAAGLGGTITLVGTPPNIIAAGAMKAAGFEPFGFFEFAWIGIPLTIAGMLPIATAMDKSGAGKMIADWVVDMMGSQPSPTVVTAVLFLLSCALTQFMSNTASTALLAPIGIGIAKGLGVSPYPVMMAIAIAASCAFATPVGTPPNTLVLGPGGYRFMDYVKAGSGLVVVCFLVSIVVIPLVWPATAGLR